MNVSLCPTQSAQLLVIILLLVLCQLHKCHVDAASPENVIENPAIEPLDPAEDEMNVDIVSDNDETPNPEEEAVADFLIGAAPEGFCGLNIDVTIIFANSTSNSTTSFGFHGIVVAENNQAPLRLIAPAVAADAAIAFANDPSNVFGGACSPLQNAKEINGKFCVINSKFCSFETKFSTCKRAGAIGAIAVAANDNNPGPFDVTNIDPDFPFVMVRTDFGNTLPDIINEDVGEGSRIFALGQGVPESCI